MAYWPMGQAVRGWLRFTESHGWTQEEQRFLVLLAERANTFR